jgi:hypothetical protein
MYMYLAKTLQIVQAFPHAGAPGSGTREQQWLERARTSSGCKSMKLLP